MRNWYKWYPFFSRNRGNVYVLALQTSSWVRKVVCNQELCQRVSYVGFWANSSGFERSIKEGIISVHFSGLWLHRKI